MSPADKDRFWSKVEKAATCWNWTAAKTRGYGSFNFGHNGGRRTVRAHRASFELANGPIPAGMVVDHICHNRGCVNPSHLRAITSKQNNEHRQGAQRNSKSGVRGVYWREECQKWTVRVGGKGIYGGLYDTIQEAATAAVALRNEVMTHNDLDRRSAAIEADVAFDMNRHGE